MKKRVLLILLICGLASAALLAQGKKKALFNGKDLTGWDINPGGEWKVEKGVIIGKCDKEDKRHGLLMTPDQYGDFKLTVVYKAVKGNSGVYFRTEKVDDPVAIHGVQAEIDPTRDAGGLYETGNRGWVAKPNAEDVKKWYKPGKWNEMVIEAKGKDVTVYVNGMKSAEVKNDPGRTKGYICLQIHGDQEVEVWFKKVEIEGEPVK
jgi:Domain of Unknown Function (DUF1080)